MTRIDDLVRAFARILTRSWDDVEKAAAGTSHGSFVDDWLQANWEMLVEAGLGPGVYLEVYGEGADSGASSRVWRPDAAATHTVVCRAREAGARIRDHLSGEDVDVPERGLALAELVARDEAWHGRRAPFDCVLIEEPTQRVFSIEDVVFALEPATAGIVTDARLTLPVWVFMGERASFPSGVFSTADLAIAWVREHRLSGTLTEYPVDVGTYQWALERGHFTPKKPHQSSRAFIGSFSSATQRHYHFDNGHCTELDGDDDTSEN